ncbi:hypothetical protein F5Y15DRAFT_41959 [Xylariaceae sp. FL0016]|nr:hypothetical protein F5Y15DRAFT_41959 [Xylariaceae sp. FL0016]
MTASATSVSPERRAMQPSEAADSYFPHNTSKAGSQRSSSSSTVSSSSPNVETSTSSPFTTEKTSPIGPQYPLPPLDREYQKPATDLNVAAQLAKQPNYWSTRGWLQRTASADPKPHVESAEARTRKFEETKKELRASAGRI